MHEPTHDEAVEALLRIRKAIDFQDMTTAIAAKSREQFKTDKLIASCAAENARRIAREVSRPLPLFDERDGISPPSEARAAKKGPSTVVEPASQVDPEAPKPTLPEDPPISSLVMPEETNAALLGFGFVCVSDLLRFHRTGVDWTNIPGIDEGGAKRLETAINKFLAGEPQQGQEGRAA